MAAKAYSSEMHSIRLGSSMITYELTRKDVKNVNLRIDAKGMIKVSASRRVPVDYIEDFLREKQEAILSAVEHARQREMDREKEMDKAPRLYADHEQLRLLGRVLEIKVIKSRTENISVEDNCLCFYVKNPQDVRHKEILYEKWLKAYQREVYERICHQVYDIFLQFGVSYPEIRIRRMTARWGSCQPYKGIITLNSRLIETPPACIEYVAVHEFSHLIYPNHSKAFHALMTKLMPDWKQRKKLLNSITEWN